MDAPTITVHQTIAARAAMLGASESPNQDPSTLARSELDLEPGTVVNGRYTIIEAIGLGGMGQVYRVRDRLNPERELALKTLSGQELDSPAAKLLIGEYRIMARIRHPNIARVYDFERLTGTSRLLFTMDLVRGTDLLRACRSLDLDRRIDLLVQICRALSYLHARGVVHFDLKPSNIMVDERATVKLLDFGIAGPNARFSKGKLLCTPMYAAPEAILGFAEPDHRYDLYSLGVILYRMLSGRLPIPDGVSVKEVLRRQCYDEFAIDIDGLGDQPAWLAALCRDLCAKHPDKRPRSANEVISRVNDNGPYAYEVETAGTAASPKTSALRALRAKSPAAILP